MNKKDKVTLLIAAVAGLATGFMIGMLLIFFASAL